MQFMVVISYEPEKRNEVIKRRIERGEVAPPAGTKILGEWNVIGGGRVFQLIDISATDFKASLLESLAWSDLCKMEVIPVMETAETMKLIPRK